MAGYNFYNQPTYGGYNNYPYGMNNMNPMGCMAQVPQYNNVAPNQGGQNFAQTQGFAQPQPQAQPNVPPSIIWVQGDEGAKSYQLLPNESRMLMDSENNFFYLKSTDGSGMPTTRKFEYKEITLGQGIPKPQTNIEPTQEMMNTFVTRKEFDTYNGNYERLNQSYDKLVDMIKQLAEKVDGKVGTSNAE